MPSRHIHRQFGTLVSFYVLILMTIFDQIDLHIRFSINGKLPLLPQRTINLGVIIYSNKLNVATMFSFHIVDVQMFNVLRRKLRT